MLCLLPRSGVISVLLCLVSFYLPLLVIGKSVSVSVYWSGGTPLCDQCVNSNRTDGFACSYGNRGNWSNGMKTFNDPLPQQSIVLGVIATMYGTFDCTFASTKPATVTLELQKEQIAADVDLPPNHSCACANCVSPYAVSRNVDRDWPYYSHGGVNTFHIFVTSDNQICLNEVKLTFEYQEFLPTVTAYFPRSGPLAGETLVSVVGSFFVPNNTDTVCLFGGQNSSAVVSDSTRLTCIAPSYGKVGDVDFVVRRGEDNLNQTSSTFHYYETPTIKEWHPHDGDVAGGIFVTITGQSFFNSTESRCRMGVSFPSVFVSSTQILCLVPPARFNTTQVVPLGFLPNGQQVIDVGNFSYHEPRSVQWLYIYVGVCVFLGMLLIIILCTLLRRCNRRKGYEQLRDAGSIVVADIKIGERIGKGNFGEVFRGVWRGTEVAIKKLSAHNLTDQMMKDFQKEVALLKALRHPNVLQFLGACTIIPDICLCTEYMPRGSLYKVLHDVEQGISWQLVKRITIDAARGCLYLHTFDPMIIHRDLKSHNLLVDDTWKVKVCDFGLSTVTENVSKAMTACGTPCWTAPEILRNQQYSEKADIYSFGVVLWECATRLDPFSGMPPFQVIFAVGREGMRLPDPRNRVPPDYLKIMKECWDENPNNRPSMMEILQRLEALDVSGFPDIPSAPPPTIIID